MAPEDGSKWSGILGPVFWKTLSINSLELLASTSLDPVSYWHESHKSCRSTRSTHMWAYHVIGVWQRSQEVYRRKGILCHQASGGLQLQNFINCSPSKIFHVLLPSKKPQPLTGQMVEVTLSTPCCIMNKLRYRQQNRPPSRLG